MNPSSQQGASGPETAESPAPIPLTGSPGAHQQCRFGECAIELGFLDAETLDRINSRKGITRQRIGDLCLQEGLMTAEQVARVVARQHWFPYVELPEKPDPDLLREVPVERMVRHRFVPVSKEDGTLLVAVSRPREAIRFLDELEVVVDRPVSLAVASQERIDAILEGIDENQSALDSVSGDIRTGPEGEAAGEGDLLSLETVQGEESITVRLVHSTLLDAVRKGASDIHIETGRSGVLIRYRIDGMLYQATDPLSADHQAPVISRIKVMSELDISEKRIPQDGRFKIRYADRTIDFRVSILPTIFGEDAVIRILDREGLTSGAGESFRLGPLGLPEPELVRLRRAIRAPYGMFLMTGPTGSGKTTTLYRALSEVRGKDVKIITIEDPVEYQLPGVTQIPVNEKKGLTFARGLRSILRHDPDKILVGEIRDAETAQIAIQSALTGHLVFTTVHANRSFEVINRFTHMGIAAFDLMSALNCIVAQRLIRTLCDDCKEPAAPAETLLLDSGLSPEECRDRRFFRPAGCDRCKGTGFKGRKAIIELVELDDDMRQLFVDRAPLSELKARAAVGGTVFLRQAALNEVFRGASTLEEANRMTFAEPVSAAESSP
jgi:type IV pilus assembly protein PilB